MRAHILDTYYGEGILDTQAKDYPGFDGLYFKVCEGMYGYMDASGNVGNVTRQIASTAPDFKSVGIYHYPRRNDEYHWQKQADAYLRQCDLLDQAGVVVDYDVQDVERTNIIGDDGKFPRAHGYHLQLMYQYITERTKRPMLLYCGPYTKRECFDYYGYTWYKEVPWIIAQYPWRAWNEGLDERAIAGEIDPDTRPVGGDWLMWQYSDKSPAGDWMPDSSAADVNVWNGTVDDMLAYFGKQSRGCLGAIMDLFGRLK